MKNNNGIVRIGNQISTRLLSVEIYINGIKYVEGQKLPEKDSKIYLKSIFKTKEQNYKFENSGIYIIDFQARRSDKVLIGLNTVLITLPFFLISSYFNLYQLISALVFWFSIKFVYNPIVLRNNSFKVRKIN